MNWLKTLFGKSSGNGTAQRASKLHLLKGLPRDEQKGIRVFGDGTERFPDGMKAESMKYIRAALSHPPTTDEAMEKYVVLDMLGANNPHDGKIIAQILNELGRESDNNIATNASLALMLIAKHGCMGGVGHKDAARSALADLLGASVQPSDHLPQAVAVKFLRVGAHLDAADLVARSQK